MPSIELTDNGLLIILWFLESVGFRSIWAATNLADTDGSTGVEFPELLPTPVIRLV
mgnify:CR=1 FL=1